MVSISSPSTRSTAVHRRGDSTGTGADRPLYLLVFSMVGLLTDCLALLVQGESSLTPLRLVLIAGAAPVAAMVASWFVGPVDEVAS
jgi:hypothetical protein